MNQQIKKYLASYYETEVSEIDLLLSKEIATSFLLIWPIFEQTLFDGFCTKGDLTKISTKSTFSKSYNEIFSYFHQRYKDKQKYHNLRHNDTYEFADSILNKEIDVITDKEKMQFITYVVYRYRNNIFHGNKGLNSWLNYNKEIEYCILFMIESLNNKKNKLTL